MSTKAGTVQDGRHTPSTSLNQCKEAPSIVQYTTQGEHIRHSHATANKILVFSPFGRRKHDGIYQPVIDDDGVARLRVCCMFAARATRLTV